ncbi:MAG: PAS domain S-box protein, partial [Ignavibacteriaceae bacterium]|nr:PAS domain S-box protein [Ignavibacteriaceae bacterium]
MGKKRNVIATFLLISALTIITAFVYYNQTIQSIKNDKARVLEAVGSLKMNQLIIWRQERIADANVLSKSPFFIKNLEWLNKTNDPVARREFKDRFELAIREYGYNSIFLLTPDKKILLSAGDSLSDFDTSTDEIIEYAQKSSSPVLSDLYYCETERVVHFDLISPVRNKDKKLIALLVLRSNPNNYLYPLLKTWPVPSKTAESVLLRREGNQVLFLNELRHRSNSALNFRLPLKESEVIAVKAATGTVGVIEGKDYRGEAVLAHISPVEKTGWYLISKIDVSEFFYEQRILSVLIIIFSVIFIVLTGFGLATIYQMTQRNTYKKLWEAEEEYKVTLSSIGDAVIATDTHGKIKFMNLIAESLTGWNSKDAVHKPMGEVFRIISEETRETVANPVDKVIHEGVSIGLANSTLLISRDGTEIPIADSAAPIRNENGETTGAVLVFRDQTKERQAKRDILRLNRVYAVLSNINQTIVRSKNIDELFPEICRIAVEDGGFMLAWIATRDPGNGQIELGAIAGGWNENYYDSRGEGAKGPGCMSLSEIVFSTGKQIIVNDFSGESLPIKCREEAIGLGFKSAGAFPSFVKDNISCVLNLYSGEKNFFNREEIVLLEELANDISLALTMYDNEEKRKAAEKSLIESEQRYADLYENSPDMFLSVDPSTGTIVQCNETCTRFTGYSKNELIGKHLSEIYHERSHEAFLNNIETFRKTGKVENSELEVVRKDGSIMNVLLNSSAVYNEKGEIVRSRSVWRDITAQKKLEGEEKKLWKIVTESLNEIYIFNKFTLKFEFANRCALTNLGYSLDEMKSLTPVDIKPNFTNESFLAEIKPLLDHQIEKANFLTRHRRKNGSVYDVEVFLQLMLAGTEEVFVAIIQDITFRKQHEIELVKREEKFRRIISSTPLGIYIYHLEDDGRLIFTDFNHAANAIIGIDHSIFIGKTIEEAFPQLIPTEVPSRYREVARTGISWSDENVEYTSNEIKGSFKVDAFQSQPGFVVVMFEDITERKRKDRELEESRRKLIRAQKIARMGDFTWDLRNNKVFWSDALYDILGYDRSEEIDYALVNRQIHHPDDLVRVTEWFRDVINSDSDTLPPNEYRIIRKDGEIITCRVTGIIERDNGVTTRIFATMQDITESKESERAIRESEETFRKLYEESADPILLLRGNRFISCNEATLKMLKLGDRSKIIDKSPMDISPEFQSDGTDSATAAAKYIALALETGYCRFEWICLRADGTPVILEVSLTPIVLSGEDLLHVGWRDITGRKKAEDALKAKSDKLTLLLEIGNTLLTSHESKQVMQHVVESASLLSNLDSAAVYTLQDELLYLEAAFPPLPEGIPGEFRKANVNDHNYIKTAIQSLEAQVLPDTQFASLGEHERLIIESRNLRSLVYVPLILKGRAIGVLILGSIGRTHDFTNDEIEVFRILANQASLEIEETKLFEQNQRYVKELEDYIEEKKRAEEAKIESEERFAKAFRNSPDGIIITELETGKIIEANESVLQLAEMELDGVL